MPPSSSTIRVLVSHSDPLLAAGITAALQDEPDMNVRLHDGSDLERIHLTTGVATDIIAADYDTALEVARSRARNPAPPKLPLPRLLVVTARDGEWHVRAAFKAGVHGYSLTGQPLHELIHAVRVMHRGARYLCAAGAARLAESVGAESLTVRETEVLCELVCGASNKVIASKLGVELGTVKTHIRALMAKLNAHSRTETVAIALRRGLIAEGSGSVFAARHLQSARALAALRPPSSVTAFTNT
jgi:DNA-binding NarL/FixJ family response regulator